MFDVNQLADMQINDANDTKAIPVPEGEFNATITKFEPRTWQSKDGSKSGVSLDITWEVDDTSGTVKVVTGRDKVTVRQSVGLDFVEGTNNLDMGKGRNIGLGRLREAVGLNQPGKSFTFNQLPGQYARVMVKHRAADDGTDTVYAEVKAVTKAM